MNDLQINPKMILAVRFSELSADYLKVFVIPLLIFDVTRSISLSGLAFFVELLPRALFAPFLGYFADNFNIKSQLLTVDLIRATLMTIIFLSKTIYIIFIFSGFVSLFSGYSFVGTETLAGRTFFNKEYSLYQSRFQMIDPIARVMGPAIGATLLNWFSLKHIILFVIIFYFVSFALRFIALQKYQYIGNKTESLLFFKSLIKGWKITFNNKLVLFLTIIGMCLNYLFGTLQSIMPALIKGSYSLADKYFSIPAMIAGVTALTGFYMVPALCKRYDIVVLGKLGICLSLFSIIIMVIHNFYIFCLGYALLVLGSAMYTVFFRTRRVEAVRREEYGSMVGVSIFLLFISLPLAGLTTYFLGKVYQPYEILITSAIICCSVAGLSFLFFRNKYNLALKELLVTK